MPKKRYSWKLHGHWVRHKRFQNEGKISYYDRKTQLVWVIWEASDPLQIGEYTIKQKTYSAGGYKPKELLLLRQYEPEPWIDLAKVRKAYNHRKGA